MISGGMVGASTPLVKKHQELLLESPFLPSVSHRDLLTSYETFKSQAYCGLAG